MDLIELMEYRRSIRKYKEAQIDNDSLKKIIYAGELAPNAGGGQRSKIIAIKNKEILTNLGKLNALGMKGMKLEGSYVSKEQPSLIDDPTIVNGFYNAPTVIAIFTPRNFLYGEADAYCIAENMLLEATNLNIQSCVIARGVETFENDYGRNLKNEWDINDDYICRCFVLLGYIDGDYPHRKAINEKRHLIIE